MNRFENWQWIVFGIVAVMGLDASAEEKSKVKTLDVKAKDVQKLEVSSGLGGYRDTLIFYTFKQQRAVLKIVIDNKSDQFPVSGTIYAFADNVTEEGLKKWLNNQHSDGLFPDVPEPIATIKAPNKACKVTAHKLIDRTKQTFGEFDNYSVDFQVSGIKSGGFQVKEFKDRATVHLKTN